jgi:hypothetical protein
MRIYGAEDRAAEVHGVKVLIVGPSGIGKTTLLTTVPQAMLDLTCFVNCEGGDLAVKGLAGKFDELRPETFQQIADLAAVLGGPDPAMPPTALYSHAHYNVAAKRVGPVIDRVADYQLLFVDSITAISRLSFAYASQQPECFTSQGAPNLLATYGLHARQLINLLRQIQRARTAHVILIGILERNTDPHGRQSWDIQIEGQRANRELPGIVDELVTYQLIDYNDGQPATRGLVTRMDNVWGFPCKDRSGRLELVEPPHLGRLITKLTAAMARRTEEKKG